MENILEGYNIFNEKNYAMYTDKANGIIEYGFRNESSVNEKPKDDDKNSNSVKDGVDFTSELDRGRKPTTIADGMSETNSESVQKITMKNMAILNYADNREIDFSKLFEKNIVLTRKNDNILLYHTHTSETYSQSDGYHFDYTGTYRTTDPKYNMINIGDVLEKSLTSANFNVVHDTTPHDYGTYENAYTKSKVTLQNNLEKHKSFGMVIDVHRDAYADLTKKVSTQINGKEVAQLMFVMGIGAKGYENPYWEDNLATALQIQKLANDMYPRII